MTEPAPHYPEKVRDAMKRAVRLEWWTLFWLALIAVMMGLAAGGSQAFRTAWIEDMLSLLAPALFLVAHRVERLEPRKGFPYGFHRAGSLAFFLAAAALAAIGGFLLYEGGKTLVSGAHPSVGSIRLLNTEIWMGWIMMGALVVSIIPPVILGQKKRKIARALHDKVLFTDADTNAADWQTGVAGIVGLFGIALGLWWADALMAVLISLSILHDGIRGLQISTISLLDGAPRRLDSLKVDPDAEAMIDRLAARYRGARIQIRETGRHVRITIEPEDSAHIPKHLTHELVDGESWRVIEVALAKRSDWPDPDKPGEPSA
jgi:cation diffusion facilitator family transporter